MKLPKTIIWVDRIDANVVAINACRAWDLPSNGVFLLFAAPPGGRLRGTAWDEVRDELERKLHKRERHLTGWYGRSWRHHLTDRITADGKPLGTPM